MINRKDLRIQYLLSNILTFILIVLTIVFYNKINLGYQNLSKLCFCFILPIITLFESLLLLFFSLLEKEEKKNDKIFKLINRYLTLILNFGQGLILLSISSIQISLLTIFIEMLGLLIVIIGNFFPKLKESNIIKTVSFTVNKDINKWNRFTRVAGFTFVLVGLIIMLLGIFDDYIIILISILLIILSGITLQIYSLALGKR